MVVLEVPGTTQRQDVSMQCMVMVSCFCEQHFLCEVVDLVCADVDMKASDPVGMEILSPLFGTLLPVSTWCPMRTSATSTDLSPRPTSPGTRVMFTYMGAYWGGWWWRFTS